MALSYDDWKNQWEWMTDVQRARVSQSMKDNATFQDYGKRYVQEQKGMNINPTWYQNNTQNTGSTVSNNQNWGTNNAEWTNTQPTVETPQNETNNTEPTQWTEGNGWKYWKTEFDPEETLQEDKFWQDPWKITIYEWTGKDTGRPDYEIETQDRLDEMAGNLDHYYATQPKLFTDRKTFNEFFQYNDRPSDQQRALLDSYWQKKQDENKAKSYTSWDALAADLNSWNMTQDVWNQVMEWNQKAYIEWQERMKNELELAIANFAAPFNPDTLADTLQSLVNKLWIQAGDPYDIIWGWENKMQELWAYQSLHELDSTVNQLKSVASQRQNVINRYASSAGWTQSDALVAARLNKALAPYDQQFSDLYTLYQTQHTTYQTKLGTANQYAQVMYQQAQEDQRIFNNKIKSLGFAMEVNSYRTPEQQAQLWLQVQSIQNDMNLLNQAKQNDLELYNQRQQNELNLEYEAKEFRLQNQLNNELTDLSVTDPKQLRANLNNVLSQYYAKFWDIIKRSQSQAVDDILAYAKANWVSVAEALTKNFIEPLQSKSEYRNMLATNYADPYMKYQDSWTYSMNEDWSISYNIKWYWKLPDNLDRWQRREIYSDILWQSWNNVAWWAVWLSTAIDDWSFTWWCWAFVNDWLVSIWEKWIFWDSLESKTKYATEQEPLVWSIFVMDSPTKWENWHVWIVTWINSDWTLEVVDSNWDWKKTKQTHTLDPKKYHIYGYYYPESLKQQSQQPSWYYDPDLVSYYEKWAASFSSTQWKSLEGMWYTPAEYKSMESAYKWEVWKKITDSENMILESLYKLKDMSKATYIWMQYWAWKIPSTSAANYKSYYDTFKSSVALQNLVNLKWQWATFGALSDNELNFIENSSTLLNDNLTYSEFMKNLNKSINDLEEWIKKRWWTVNIWVWSEWDEYNQILFPSLYQEENVWVWANTWTELSAWWAFILWR